MANQHILAVDNESNTLKSLTESLEQESFRVTGFSTGNDSLKAIAKDRPHLILLSLLLPDADGFEMLQRLKSDAETQDIPIVALSAKNDDEEAIKALNLGADDYIAKPFNGQVLAARVKAVLRRLQLSVTSAAPGSKVNEQRRPIKMNREKLEAEIEGKVVVFTDEEFDVLDCMARKPGIVMTSYQILQSLRAEERIVSTNDIDGIVLSIRDKLGPSCNYIEYIVGIGYRFRE